jgi:site-specific DNA-methyltransferase (adenine-specific)
MGQKWDKHKSPAAYAEWCSLWAAEALRVLKPGSHLLAFGGTRTFHRLACGIEDAGFEIRDCVSWLHSQGFPKSQKVAGFEGWGTALKPSWEPCLIARKQPEGTIAANAAKWGTGGINVDRCRIETDDKFGGGKEGTSGFAAGYKHDGWKPGSDKGRWPPNVALDEQAAAMLDEQSGVLTSGKRKATNTKGFSDSAVFGSGKVVTLPALSGDSGGASRFFYCAKANKQERNGNQHPTVKPVALMRWLVRLVTPIGGIVLDPFAGSGSTLVAAMEEGFEAIGIEAEAEYIEIIENRLQRQA